MVECKELEDAIQAGLPARLMAGEGVIVGDEPGGRGTDVLLSCCARKGDGLVLAVLLELLADRECLDGREGFPEPFGIDAIVHADIESERNPAFIGASGAIQVVLKAQGGTVLLPFEATYDFTAPPPPPVLQWVIVLAVAAGAVAAWVYATRKRAKPPRKETSPDGDLE